MDSARARAMVPDSELWRKAPRTDRWSGLRIGDTLVLLADGTEWTRVPSPAPKEAPPPGWAERLDWARPETGIDLSLEADGSKTPGSATLFLERGRLLIRPGIGRWFSVVAGMGWDRELSGTTIPVRGRHWSHPDGPSWIAGLCGPTACVEAEHHSIPVASQVWLQPGLDSLAASGSAGEFWRSTADTFDGAWEVRASVRLVWLRYRVSWCPGLWKGLHQEIGLHDMPAGRLRFGTGVEWTAHRAAVRAELGAAPIGTGSIATWFPLDLSAAFRSDKDVQLHAVTTLRFKDPLPALVGRFHR